MLMNRRDALLGAAAIPWLGAVQTSAASAGGQGATPDQLATLAPIVEEEMRATGTPGAAIAVVVGDRAVLTRGFGQSSTEEAVPVGPDTLFRIASTTKMLTAAAIVTQALRGTLDLHAPIARELPTLPRGLRDATLHHLLTHTAGLRDETVYFGLHDDAELGRFVAGWHGDVQLAPVGDVYSYSNLGYGLAGHLLERATRLRFADAMRRALFAPLGMERSAFRPVEAMTYPIAQGHEPSPAGPAVVRPFADNVRYWPNGGAFTSARDYARFAVALLNEGRVDGRQALAADVVTAMLRGYADVPGAPGTVSHRYGYGLNVRSIGGRRVLQHGGERIGFGSLFRIMPDERVGVIVLGNRTGASLVRSLEAATAAGLAMAPPPSPSREPALPVQHPTAADFPPLERLLGRYVNKPGELAVELLREDGHVVLRGNGGEAAAPVERLADGRYSAGGQSFSFVRGARSGAIYLFVAGRALARRSG